MSRQPGLPPDGPKIRQLRIGRGITVTDLARQIGRHKDTIWGVEGEKKRPMSDVLASQLARALSTPDEPVTVEDITDRDDEDESEPETPDRLSA
jgi:DNA-binding XRE family transcriptional regulator